jgi:hypothetical protein
MEQIHHYQVGLLLSQQAVAVAAVLQLGIKTAGTVVAVAALVMRLMLLLVLGFLVREMTAVLATAAHLEVVAAGMWWGVMPQQL